MILTIPRKELQEALHGLGKVISRTATLPVLRAIQFSADDGVPAATATDLDQVARYRFESGRIEQAGAPLIIEAARLKALAKGAKDDLVTLRGLENGSVSLTGPVAGRTLTTEAPGFEPEEWPALEGEVPTRPAEGFIETYRRLTPFSSTDETRQVLGGVYLEVGTGENPITMVATDGRRLASWNNLSLPIKESVIVPVTRFLGWSRLPDDVHIGLRAGNAAAWFGVKAGAFSYAVKTVEGAFPNFRQVIPAQPGGNVISFAESDVALLREVLPSTFPGDEEIILLGRAGEVTLYGRGPEDRRWTTLTLENTAYRGDRTFIGLNRHFLLDALAAGFLEVAVTDEFSPVMSRDGHGGTHVLMPIRVEDPEEAQGGGAAGETSTEKSKADPPHAGADAGDAPAPATHPKPTRRRSMSEKIQKTDELAAFAELQAAAGEVKTKLQEARAAAARVAAAAKAAMKEARAQRAEVEAARATLAKLKAIDL